MIGHFKIGVPTFTGQTFLNDKKGSRTELVKKRHSFIIIRSQFM